MDRDAKSGRLGAVRTSLFGVALAVAAFAAVGDARAEPPIKSAQDAYCRTEARARVFGEPDPQNAGLQTVGRRLYYQCMARFSGSRRAYGRGHGRRHRHHHRRR